MPYVFLSYHRRDSAFVKKFISGLKAQGIDSWIDQEETKRGELWERQIATAIEKCTAFLILLTPSSIKSAQIARELNTALASAKPVFPMTRKIGVDSLPTEMQVSLANREFIDFSGEFDPAFAQLVQSLSSVKELAIETQTPDRLPDDAPALDPNRFPIYKPTRIYLPEQYLPEKQHIKILNQGTEGSVVGFAIAELINYLTSRRGQMYQASPRMLYELAKTYDGVGEKDQDRGSWLWAGLYGWSVYGVADETTWPYVAGKSDRRLTVERVQAAGKLKPKSFERIPKDKDTLRTAIIERGAVVCSSNIHENWMKMPLSTIPFSPEARMIGAIAFVLLGYTREGFIVQLSWGTEQIGIDIDGVNYPGLVIWRYPDFEKNFVDAWVVQLPEPEEKIARGLRAGYISDDVHEVEPADDQLNVMPDVRAICAVLAARDVQPPLALGLFGNWGTGKSFFMQLMKYEIRRLAEMAKLKPGETPFYERIVQIEFNAWHYLDTNLWASLVSKIFSRLQEEFTAKELPEKKRQALLKELGEAEGLYRVSHYEFEEAQRQQQNAQAEFDQYTRKKQRLLTLEEIKQKSVLVSQAFGMPEIADSTAALVDLITQVEDVDTRLGKLWKIVWQPDKRLKTITWLVILILGPLALGWLVSLLASNAPETWQWITGSLVTVLSFIVSIGGLLTPYLRRLNKGLTTLQETTRQIQTVPEVKNSGLEAQLSAAKTEVKRTQAEEDAAKARLDEAKKRVGYLKGKLEELNPRWQMQQFILDRSTSKEYTRQLGMVSLVHRDFDRLSELLRRTLEQGKEEAERLKKDETPQNEGLNLEASEEAAESKIEPTLPFQRIILFIDDLDRCTPERVIDVLEAVHLLLAFPLFIVVVAVDPRWLRTCLEIRYKDLLAKDPRRSQGEAGLGETATPQDYLEKIFQIPFYLRPLSGTNYKTMVQSLLGTEVAPEAGETELPKGLTTGEPPTPTGVPPIEAPASGAPPRVAVPRVAPVVKPPEEEVSPDRLSLRKKELDDMLRLYPLFRTPRAVKRFINTYRLVRVGIQAEDLEAFIDGRSGVPATYRIAMALLAIVAGYPNLAPRFLRLLLDEMSSPQPALTWADFLERCRKAGPERRAGQVNTVLTPTPTGAAATGAGMSSPGSSRQSSTPVRTAAGSQPNPAEGPSPTQPYLDEEDFSALAAWDDLCNALQSISRDDFLPKDINLYYDLIPKVARFSFSVSDLPELRKK